MPIRWALLAFGITLMRILACLLIVFLTEPAVAATDDWLPMAVGNRWRYIQVWAHEHPDSLARDWINIRTVEIRRTEVVNDRTYYVFSEGDSSESSLPTSSQFIGKGMKLRWSGDNLMELTPDGEKILYRFDSESEKVGGPESAFLTGEEYNLGDGLFVFRYETGNTGSPESEPFRTFFDSDISGFIEIQFVKGFGLSKCHEKYRKGDVDRFYESRLQADEGFINGEKIWPGSLVVGQEEPEEQEPEEPEGDPQREWAPIEPVSPSDWPSLDWLSAGMDPEAKVYWTDSKKGIFRSNLDGSNPESILVPDWLHHEALRPSTMALDTNRGKVYWLDSIKRKHFLAESWVPRGVGGNLRRADLDGSNVEQLLFWANNFALDVTRNDMYWANWHPNYDHPPEGGIGRIHLSGRTEDDYYKDLGVIYETGIALDVEGGHMYWTNAADRGGIYQADLEIKKRHRIITGLPGLFSEIALDFQGKVYWADWDWDRSQERNGWIIRRANIDDPQIEDLLEIETWWWDGPTGLTVDTLERKIYWRDHKKFIHRANLDGSQVEKLGRATGFALDVDGRRIVWTDEGGRMHWAGIDRTDLGSHIDSFFISRVGKPYDLALDASADKLYWTDLSGAIHVSNVDGSNAQILVDDLDEPRGIALDGLKIYWADWGAGKIQSANLDGSQIEDIAIGVNMPHAIGLDKARSKLYWTLAPEYPNEAPTFPLWRSDLDGSNAEGVQIDDFSGPASIALDGDRGHLYWTYRREIWRSDLDGSNVRALVTEDDIFAMEAYDYTGFSASHHGIALDLLGGKIYWASYEESMPRWHDTSSAWELTFRCNLDGSQIEVIGERGRGADNMVVRHTALTAVSPNAAAAPGTSSLQQNVPNPFNSTTRMAYRLASAGPTRLDIFNVTGQRVRTLVDEVHPAGFYQAIWDARDQHGSDVAAGVYLARLRYPGGMQTRRLLLLK